MKDSMASRVKDQPGGQVAPRTERQAGGWLTRLFGRKPAPAMTRAEALGAWLDFMEGRSLAHAFTFGPGEFSSDQIVRDVEGIILHATREMQGKPWSERLAAFQRQRSGRTWTSPK